MRVRAYEKRAVENSLNIDNEIQYNRNSVKCEHFENLISTFRLSYSHHQEVNDDIITYVQVYIEVTRYGLVKY